MKKAYIFLSNGFEEVEGLTAVDLLRRAGVEVTMVSIDGALEVQGSHGITVKVDALFENVAFSDMDLLILPGGMPGTKHLMAHEGLKAELIKAKKGGKEIGAICAAPTVLGAHGLLEGEEAVCYPGMEDGLTGAKIGDKEVVVSHHITTSRGVGTAIPFALSLIETLEGKEKARQIANSIVFTA